MSQKLDWRPMGGLQAYVIKGDRRLGLITTTGADGWNLLAVEASKDASSADEVFEDHSHDSVASDIPLETVMRLGQTYAAAWLAGDQEAIEKCKCETIRAPAMPDDPATFDVASLQRAYAVGERLCPGCRGLDGEHTFGVTCTLREGPFHAHLEKCAQCREHPFALCAEGVQAMSAEMDVEPDEPFPGGARPTPQAVPPDKACRRCGAYTTTGYCSSACASGSAPRVPC
jgi:hypothetical protein